MQSYLRLSGRARRKQEPEDAARDLENELADVLGHVLLLAERFDLDIDDAVKRKWRLAD